MQESTHVSPYRNDGKLYGFVAIVTGTSQPVGQSIVLELATHGAAAIFLCDQSVPDGFYDSLLATCAAQHPNTKLIPYPLAVANEEATVGLIDDVLNWGGRLDLWICCAGILGPASIADTGPEQLTRCFETNSMAAFYALKYAPAAMGKLTGKGHYANAAPKDQPYGSIIIVTSTASLYGGCWGPAYTMTCHAAVGLVRSGVAVLKGTGVRINAISTGQIDVGVKLEGSGLRGMTGQFPPASLQTGEMQRQNIGLERTGLPEEVARAAGFLASGFSSYVTGTNLVVDGGASVMNPLMVPL